MDREYGRELVKGVLEEVKARKIEIVPLTEKIVEKSSELLNSYNQLNIFDSVHAAFSIVGNETILSTDRIFKKIPGVKHLDPRDL